MFEGDDDGPRSEYASLAQYFAGEAGAEERDELETQMEINPSFMSEVAELRRRWEIGGALPTRAHVEAMWRKLASRMGDPLEASENGAKARPARFRKEI